MIARALINDRMSLCLELLILIARDAHFVVILGEQYKKYRVTTRSILENHMANSHFTLYAC